MRNDCLKKVIKVIKTTDKLLILSKTVNKMLFMILLMIIE